MASHQPRYFRGCPFEVVGRTRIRHSNPVWGYYNVIRVRFTDAQTPHSMSMPLGAFNKIMQEQKRGGTP